MADTGRPTTSDEQFQLWLDAMKPFLENSNSLYYAICQSGLLQHQTTIYEKYRIKDWFSQKVDRWRETPGEMVNDTLVSLIRNINEKAKRKELITPEDIKILTFYAEKARVSQPFFVNRTETAEAKPLADVLGELDNDADTGQDDVATEAAKQVVEAEPPVQDQNQIGSDSDVSVQPNAVETPSPTEGS